MSRIPLIAGNWKMNNTKRETLDFLSSFLPKVENITIEMAICPPFTDLYAAAEKLKGTKVKLGAQNMHWEETGAFTGEVSPLMLKEIPCDYVIIGHSERRQYFAETDETVNKKIKSAIKHNIAPIVCVGESLAQREEGITIDFVMTQVENALKDIKPEDAKKIVFAYEPIWAIGTGKTASASDAQEVIGAIRNKIEKLYNKDVAEDVRILYGGSVKPENIKELMAEADIDGALVGGASLKPDSFYALCSFNL
ncbi:triose-phosphate isomerase [Tepidanaerobacter sp. GT38]|uniref:triose-phosphate isomerase n=1 Tax=Tepidanaerobacter sp. GT38 TaxID=2722793 RepID=UPI00351CE890|nr:triose-phosphate isomerase [Tepidanaerobacter sp. GT38]